MIQRLALLLSEFFAEVWMKDLHETRETSA